MLSYRKFLSASEEAFEGSVLLLSEHLRRTEDLPAPRLRGDFLSAIH